MLNQPKPLGNRGTEPTVREVNRPDFLDNADQAFNSLLYGMKAGFVSQFRLIGPKSQCEIANPMEGTRELFQQYSITPVVFSDLLSRFHSANGLIRNDRLHKGTDEFKFQDPTEKDASILCQWSLSHAGMSPILTVSKAKGLSAQLNRAVPQHPLDEWIDQLSPPATPTKERASLHLSTLMEQVERILYQNDELNALPLEFSVSFSGEPHVTIKNFALKMHALDAVSCIKRALDFVDVSRPHGYKTKATEDGSSLLLEEPNEYKQRWELRVKAIEDKE